MAVPDVAIIIPSFNREALISDTLDSLKCQTLNSWETIVVDDGSDDKTLEVIKNYAEKDSRIKLIKRNRLPKGASVCRNIGLENINARYVIFLDSDDLLAPYCLEKRIDYMEQHPDLDFAVFQMRYFNASGFLNNLEQIKSRNNYLYAFLRHDLPWNITCPIWKTRFLKDKLNGYNENYPRLQDPELNTRALMVDGVKFEVLLDSEPDSYCRMHYTKILNVIILLTGFKLYIEEFSQRIKIMPDYLDCKRQLKLSFIEAVRCFYSYYKPIFHNESIRLLAEISRFAYKDKLISAQTHLLTNLLILTYRSRISSLSWGKYVFKAIMKLIKMS